MAPSRRKGASKAAAAAAARRQWKVGDLVLAKVKGFPAWPATVSEPEKWGYSVDLKKVLVFFFGTQQIAFCSPSDVEAFTEEKKESLLSKRHGKGADFVRAVREIIDSYEELKKQGQSSSVNTIGEAALTNGVESEKCVARSESKDEAPTPNIDSGSKILDSSKPYDDLGIPVEGDVATTRDVIHNGDTVSKEPSVNLVVTKTPLPTTYSRKKHTATKVSIMQKGSPSVRRSKESCRSQNLEVLSDCVKNNGNLSTISHDKVLRRIKRVRRSPDSFDEPDNISPHRVSNMSHEENASETVTIDSDTQSHNEGICQLSSYKPVEPECIMDCFGGDVKLSETPEFQSKAVIIKKKRRPSRKRTLTATNEIPDKFDKQLVSSVEVSKTEPIQNTDLEKSEEKYSKDDGDEHLPLVKRARVRMGRTSSEASNSKLGQKCIASSDREDSSAEGSLLATREELDHSSSLRKSNFTKPPLWELKKHKNFGSLTDGEAALPPSKRLHRALEAMSANAAEDKQISPEGSRTMKTFINVSLSTLKDRSNLAIESKVKDEFEVQKMGSNLAIDTQFSTPVERVNEIDACSQPPRSSCSPNHLCEDVIVKSVEHADGRDSGTSSSCTNAVETIAVLQSPKPSLDAIDRKDANHDFDGNSMASMFPIKNESEIGTSELVEPWKKDHSDVSVVTSENGIVSHGDVDLLVHSTPVKRCKMADDAFNEDGNDIAISKDVEGTKKSTMEIDASPSLPAVEVLKAAAPGPELSQSTSISEDCLSHRTVSGTRTSSSPTDGLDSTQASLPHTSICNISASKTSNFLENNGCYSPDVHLHHKKPKHDGKWSVTSEANAALTSFEASLASLTRTKKSIDRATRIAIDCAKFGVAVKVVDIIARNLEGEPSLHKRVDLFFLVDSIAQCSRGLKGYVADLYPSAIQVLLPRLLLAAAPPGSNALENRRQCLKVLKLWQERKILPEPMIRHHIRELDSLNNNMSSRSGNSRRPFRNERAFDDPVREVEGMLVDEYGSNSSFPLAGFNMPTMLKDRNEGSDSDREHDLETSEERDTVSTPATEKHTRILEDVDGELEMEDVNPSCEGETTTTINITPEKASETSHYQLPTFAPPLPEDLPPSSPPLPNSPPPPPPAALPPPPPPPPPPLLSPPALLPPPPPLNDNILRPPHHAPSSQFSYFQAEVTPPSYPVGFQFVNSTDSGNLHSDHDRTNVAPHDESWTFPPPPFSGQSHPDGGRVPFSPSEPPGSSNAWPYPPRPVNQREMAPHGPFFEPPVPMAARGPNFWRQ